MTAFFGAAPAALDSSYAPPKNSQPVGVPLKALVAAVGTVTCTAARTCAFCSQSVSVGAAFRVNLLLALALASCGVAFQSQGGVDKLRIECYLPLNNSIPRVPDINPDFPSKSLTGRLL